MWDLGGWHEALGQTLFRDTEATKTDRENRERQHLNSSTDNTKMVVVEAYVIRRISAPGATAEYLRSYLVRVPAKREEISGEVAYPQPYAKIGETET